VSEGITWSLAKASGYQKSLNSITELPWEILLRARWTLAKKNESLSNELESLIVQYFCRGEEPARISELLERDHKIKLRSPRVWGLLAAAAGKGRFRYVPAEETVLREELKQKYPAAGLNRIEVVGSVVVRDLAFKTAETLLEMLSEHHRNKSEAHIGFAGGGMLLRVAKSLSELLRDSERIKDVPRKLFFHSMVAGWNVDEPGKDPNSFSAILAGNQFASDFDIHFVGLRAPGVVSADMYRDMQGMVGIKESFDVRDQIDIIVTSAGRWECKHSALYRLYSKYSEPTIVELEQAGCVGDLMWCPFNSQGQISALKTQPTIQAFTLMQIDELHDFICKRGKHVLLVLGPCSSCGEPKTRVFQTIANLAPTRRYATHLVCDCRTANRLLVDADDPEKKRFDSPTAKCGHLESGTD
jgi:DNA-binding transcriptional regulator LsrR (DeoR family)